jgi:hypothetical protein
MRRSVLVLTFSLAGCVTAPRQPEPPPPSPVAATQPETRRLIGLTATDLVGHFGSPALQVREGNSLKLQFRGRRCVLDAYLYPSPNGGLRVTYIDTRATSGVDTAEDGCIAALESRS